jgi:outer membrane protein assembly factor BamB
VIVGDVLVTIEQRRDNEAVVRYDAATGKEIWAYEYPAHFQETLGGPGPRATPTIADGEVFSLGATGHLACLDGATGKMKWTVNILDDNDNIQWAMSGSPLVYDDLVVVNPGAQRSSAKGRALIAYDRKTGKQVWAAGDTRAGYSSPMLATLAGKRQVVMFDAAEVAGYDAKTGEKIWNVPFETYQGINVAQPILYDDDRVFISAGYDHGSAMIQIDASGKPKELWKTRKLRSKFSNPVAHAGHIYGLDDGILVCLDEKTGQLKWKGERYGHGQVLLADGLLVILSEQGDLAIVEATPDESRQLGRLSAIKGRTWNYHALAAGRVYVRNDQEMAALDLRKME